MTMERLIRAGGKGRAFVLEHHRRQRVHRRSAARAGVYGVTTEDVEFIEAIHAGRCAICRQKCGVGDLDHDHATRRVRGLLCHRCNAGLGVFRDQSGLLMRAARYVAWHKEAAK